MEKEFALPVSTVFATYNTPVLLPGFFTVPGRGPGRPFVDFQLRGRETLLILYYINNQGPEFYARKTSNLFIYLCMKEAQIIDLFIFQ